jgi:hypothetical protein
VLQVRVRVRDRRAHVRDRQHLGRRDARPWVGCSRARLTLTFVDLPNVSLC